MNTRKTIGIILMVGSLIMETFSAKNHDKN